MDENRTGSFPAHHTENRLIRAVNDAVKRAYANSERTDCPSSEAIQAVVVRQLSHPNFDDVVDHIATCAPCLEEYNRRRQRYRFQRRCRWVAGFAALLLVGLLLWRNYPSRHQRPKEQLAKETLLPPVAAALDYSAWTAERSASPLPRNPETPRLARGRLALTLLLPIGTEDGSYSVQILSASGEIVAHATGIATWTGGAEKLNINLDLTALSAGAYTIAIRPADGSARTYPVLLE